LGTGFTERLHNATTIVKSIFHTHCNPLQNASQYNNSNNHTNTTKKMRGKIITQGKSRINKNHNIKKKKKLPRKASTDNYQQAITTQNIRHTALINTQY
jgi:hypothetical protein